jgi:K(+)-stimulated pyrophosphate-energized sodium pump
VALNPIIKFSTLFGLLAVEIAVNLKQAAIRNNATDYAPAVGVVLLLVGLVFVWRSFYAMRIPPREVEAKAQLEPVGSGAHGGSH